MKEIPLTQGKFALVDDADYDWLNQWKWCAWTPDGKTFYAKRATKTKTFFMHIVVFGVKGVDHRDSNGLNNQRENLRAANKSQNGCNRGANQGNKSGLKGVSWAKRDKLFRARITLNGKSTQVGTFKNSIDAAKAYDAAAIKLHGEFAKTNQSLGLLTE
jgi:hypothetical protein